MILIAGKINFETRYNAKQETEIAGETRFLPSHVTLMTLNAGRTKFLRFPVMPMRENAGIGYFPIHPVT